MCVGNPRLGIRKLRTCVGDLGVELFGIDTHQRLAGAHGLIIFDQHSRYETSHFGSDRSGIRADVRIVCALSGRRREDDANASGRHGECEAENNECTLRQQAVRDRRGVALLRLQRHPRLRLQRHPTPDIR